MPPVEKDYEELLRLFNKHRVRYCIIGAYAVGFFARPRYTKDLDLLIEPTIQNGTRVVQALQEFGFKSLKLAADDFSRPGRIVQLGYEPVRVDLLTSIPGCTFARVWQGRRRGRYGSVPTLFIGLNELMANKRRSHRAQDQADLQVLQRLRRKT